MTQNFVYSVNARAVFSFIVFVVEWAVQLPKIEYHALKNQKNKSDAMFDLLRRSRL